MTFPRPAAFPGGRVLAGWWKQLAAWRPNSLWIGSIALERVEALCNICQSEPLTALDGMLLANLNTPTETAQLDRRLGVGNALLGRLLANLEKKGALIRNGQGWTLTEVGMRARQDRTLPGRRMERRSFWFVAGAEGSESRAFIVPTALGAFQPVQSNRIDRGSLEALEATVQSSPEWKQTRGFPLEVETILPPEAASASNDLAAWQKIVIVHPYRLQAALVSYRRESGQPGIAAFPYQEHGWSLAPAPVIDLAASWQEIFPYLPFESAEEVVTDAWRKWLAQRGMTGPAMDHYRLERHAERIGVVPPAGMPDVLGAPRGDLVRGEAWLLLQDGPLRRAMPMELEPTTPPETMAGPAGHKPG